MNKKWILFAAVLIPALLLSACNPSGGNVAASKVKREANPNVPAADIEQLTAGNTVFAFDLYQAVRGGDGNLVYSPYSISLAFAMAYGGARGATESQMANVLHYDLPADQFHPPSTPWTLTLPAARSRRTAPRASVFN
jgi:serpin B